MLISEWCDALRVVVGVVEQGRLLHPVLVGHPVVVQDAARAPAHRPGLVLDPLRHAPRLYYLRVSVKQPEISNGNAYQVSQF